MQRAASSNNIASLLHQPLPQSPQRAMSFHEQDRSHQMGPSALSNLLPPLVGVSQDSLHDQRPELPRPYKCPLCEKAFHRLEHQTRHIRTHTGEKPHGCNFPGCSKRFSRSDELTRHSRIHTNPNSRRSNKNQHTALAAAAQVSQHDGSGLTSPKMMPPPPKIVSKSAPSSHVGSPNVSPPHSYHGMHAPSIHSGLTPFGRATSGPAIGSSQGGLDLSVLAQTASQQLERERHHYHHPQHHFYLSNRLPQISPLTYKNAQPMSRSHSHEDDDPYSAHRSVKKSRPSSPVSTAPSSPTFSHSSCSPTPESTPLATPAHSPRLYPRDLEYNMQLPSIRQLSLRHMPALAPMDVADPYNVGVPPVAPSQPSGLRLGDIINRPDGAQRKLPVPPVPRVAVHDLLNSGAGGLGFSSNSSSTANSVAGGDLADRI